MPRSWVAFKELKRRLNSTCLPLHLYLVLLVTTHVRLLWLARKRSNYKKKNTFDGCDIA
jgi:hypothetical protein